MEVALVKIDRVQAQTLRHKPITAGTVGAQVRLEYADPIWSGLSKMVIFSGAAKKDVITNADVITIPAEVVAAPGYTLKVGIYGTDADGQLALPTLWAYLGKICDGANPSYDVSTDPHLPVWAQIQGMIGNLDDLDTSAKENLVAAVNEALTRGGGAVDEAAVKQIVEDYLAENPPAEGTPGADGGYYTPSVTQPDANTMRISYTPSAEDMPPVVPKDITLPAGKDGAGMEITGATVGQIARITAVDDTGRPTAWEPVDLPSGAKETWELIRDVTVEEDVSSVELTDLSEYSKFCLEFRMNISAATQVFVTVNGADASAYQVLNIAYSNAGFRAMRGYIFTDLFLGVTRGIGTYYMSSNALENINWNNSVSLTTVSNRTVSYGASQFPIQKIKIAANVSNIVAGGIVRLWGVKK